LLLQILPVAIAITVNPVPIVAALIMSATRRPARNGVTYVAVLVGVMAVFGALVLLLLNDAAFTPGSRADLAIHIAWLAVGLGFLAACAVMVARKPVPGSAGHEPRWMRLIGAMGPLGAAAVGVLLVNYEMETPAVMDILGADLPRGEAFAALALFIAVACSIPIALVMASIVARRRVVVVMQKGKVWLTLHQRPILIALFAVIGSLYTAKGLLGVA
jgi:hypothetical protein